MDANDERARRNAQGGQALSRGTSSIVADAKRRFSPLSATTCALHDGAPIVDAVRVRMPAAHRVRDREIQHPR
jgi:hypothetical protein